MTSVGLRSCASSARRSSTRNCMHQLRARHARYGRVISCPVRAGMQALYILKGGGSCTQQHEPLCTFRIFIEKSPYYPCIPKEHARLLLCRFLFQGNIKIHCYKKLYLRSLYAKSKAEFLFNRSLELQA